MEACSGHYNHNNHCSNERDREQRRWERLGMFVLYVRA